MLAHIDAHQLAEWRAFYDLEPWGDMREDFRAGQVCATVANYAGKMRGEGVSPANPAEFMPSLREFSPSQDSRPILLPDRKAHAALLRKTIFNKDD